MKSKQTSNDKISKKILTYAKVGKWSDKITDEAKRWYNTQPIPLQWNPPCRGEGAYC